MTLHRDRDRPKRPPMQRRTLYFWLGGVAAVFIFVAIALAVSGQSFF